MKTKRINVLLFYTSCPEAIEAMKLLSIAIFRSGDM